MVEVPAEVIERLSTKGIVVGTIVDKEALAELRALLDAPAAEPAMVDLLKIQMELLDWNRAQPNPPIQIAHEYAVAEQALKIMGKAPAVLEISDAQLERLGQYVYEELGSPSEWCGFDHDGARKALGAVRPPMVVPVGNSDPRPIGPVLLDKALEVFEAAACKKVYRMVDGVRAVLELVQGRDIAPMPPETVPKHKFDCLVEHCKRLDEEIARYRREAHDLRLYQDNAVWFWQGDNQDHLESLSCPVVIPASELRELLETRPGMATMSSVMRACEAAQEKGLMFSGTSNWCAFIAKALNGGDSPARG
jgi:hypothetical protein